MSGRVTDDGLSEVIGFILIIAIIVILGSLYMTYVVPSQGRDAEIQHMQNVEKFFTDFKMNIDSLWYNNQEGVSFNQQLSLGTGGQTSGGAFSIFPVMQPVASSGKVAITQMPNLSLTIINGTFINITGSDAGDIKEDYSAIFVNYSTNIYPNQMPPFDPHTLTIYPTNITSSRLINPWELVDWVAVLEVKNATLRQEDLYHVLNWTEHPETREVSHLEILNYPVKEVTLSVIKNGMKTIEDEVIYRGLVSPYTWNETIRVNLMEEAYGLSNDQLIRSNLSYVYTRSDGSPPLIPKNPSDLFEYITYYGNSSSTGDLDYITANITMDTTPIGTFNYSSQNPYWINQEYIYQCGEVQLKQNGIIQPKISSNWIQVSPAGNICNVHINLISLFGDALVGGHDEVQITSTLKGVRHNIINSGDNWYKLKEGIIENAKGFLIQITASDEDEARYYKKSIDSLLKSDGLTVESGQHGKTVNVNVTPKNNYNLHLTLNHALVEMKIDSRVYG
ncbi:hypothetical protein Mhun_2428 [Methanospirillum hungatei JF-1]|uniref:Uncharacterized protein n=1 Tax=Methanospirillum hungatei JF-1 (strain ATCC 27890 / DSM 864 / NBRC 100397 / JF-1) TaxID=323259 RepID=Q2FTW9_METHJ|nr:hypothetical protein [Methanospirillum hungatei]ABD42129.1 hypothetical protein Mhun_2428 [Methanospirillum hungatei JF-1]